MASGLAHQEDWELCADGGTKLPQKFISGVNEFCLLAKDVVKVQPAEENIFDRIQVEAELRGLMASILCQFPATLSSLALKVRIGVVKSINRQSGSRSRTPSSKITIPNFVQEY